MTESDFSRRWQARITQTGRKLVRGSMLAGVLAAVLGAGLTGCGGGSRVDPFVPTRLIAFGDEYSVINASDGTRYTVNYLPYGATRVDCGSYPTWLQLLTAHFNLDFAVCPRSSGAVTNAFNQAQVGAKVAQVTSQIDSYVASSGFHTGDVVTVLAGVNDIRSIYETYAPAAQLDNMRTAARAAGEQLGNKIATITAGGARVLLFTAPDIGLTPYAIAKKLAAGGTAATDPAAIRGTDCSTDPAGDQQKVLSMVTACFNNGLRAKIENDGSKIALVASDQLTQLMASSPSSYSLSNVYDSLCKAGTLVAGSTPTCKLVLDASNNVDTTATSATMNTTSTSDINLYLWAGDVFFAPTSNIQLGNRAISQARTNWQ